MRKQTKQLLILLIIFVLVMGGLLGVRAYNRKQVFEALNESAEQNTGITVLDINEEEVLSFSYDFADEIYDFAIKEDNWYYTEDESLSLTQYMIWYMVEQLAPFTVQVQIDGVTDFGQYGLEEPAKVIRFATAAEEYTIEIGDFNEMTSTYYARFSEEDTVYTVSEAMFNAFQKGVEDVTEAPEAEATEAE